MDNRRVTIFDTTLRDGEQTPGVHLSRSHKLETAKALAALGVDVIEAGFPASSPLDEAAVRDIAAAVGDRVTVCALCRCAKADIDTAAAALKDCAKPRLHVFIATSDLHLSAKLKMTREEALAAIRESVTYAVSLCPDTEFSCEDATRSDRAFLKEAVRTALDCGAKTVNIPDTVGYALPEEYGALIAEIVELAKPYGAVVSAHCHDDLGLAVANTVAALENGAGQAECTVNGVGERAGNAPLEEIVMAIRTRSDSLAMTTGIVTERITQTSRLIASMTGVAVSPCKAVVGANVFLHGAGIHQHGVLCDKRTYEIMTPESVGVTSANLPLGRLSGRHAFAERVASLGYRLSDDGMKTCFTRFKEVAERKAVDDEDIMALVGEYLDEQAAVYRLEAFQIQAGTKVSAMAMVTLSCRGVTMSEAALGDGPIDAAFNAVSRLCGADDVKLAEYGIRAVTEGNDALGEAKVKLLIAGVPYTGRGVSTDIIEASVKAYVNALNKWCAQ